MATRLLPRFRHWRQQYEPHAQFIWRRRILWNGEWTVPGEAIPDSLASNPKKLRSMWDTQQIELEDCSAELEAEVGFEPAETLDGLNTLAGGENAGGSEGLDVPAEDEVPEPAGEDAPTAESEPDPEGETPAEDEVPEPVGEDTPTAESEPDPEGEPPAEDEGREDSFDGTVTRNGNWYTITFPDGRVEKVLGKKARDESIVAYTASE